METSTWDAMWPEASWTPAEWFDSLCTEMHLNGVSCACCSILTARRDVEGRPCVGASSVYKVHEMEPIAHVRWAVPC